MSDTALNSTAADTIVLVHGLWMTPRSWEHWVTYYSEKGYKVLTPAYPGFEVEVEELRANPTIIETSTVPNVVAHLEEIIGALDKPPILTGHSFGGTLVQILLDHGFGAAGVVIDSAPTEGVLVNPISQIKSLFPILSHPGERGHTAPFTAEQFHYAFTNTMSEEEAAMVYERYYIPAPATFVWGGVLANVTPGHQATYVNYHNDDRAPLLFIAGGEDNIMPASVNKSNANHYKHSKAVTDFHEFPGRCHFTCGQEGWEAVADYALEWATKNQKVAEAVS
ncbi:alpha/beta hydrolase [bacterium]|nr:MAG: alpha/beta hydrolase [bacterium]